MESLSEKVLGILSEHPELESRDLTLDTTFRDDLGLDSLVVAELTIELEDHFNIRFPEDALKNIVTVGDVVQHVDALI